MDDLYFIDQALELAKALGYEIRWEKVRGAND